MFAALLLPWFLAISPSLAAPSPVPRACQTVQSGNLSPNGVSGNFGLFKDVLGFDPTNLATGFDVTLQTCASSANASVKTAGVTAAGPLIAPTGQCLAVQNLPSINAPGVVAVDCATAGATAETNWALYDGFLFWAGPVTTDCSSGLYGYQATSSSGNPAAVQKAPVSLACLTAKSVFGFSVLY